MRTQRGFAPILLLLLVLAIGVVGVTTYVKLKPRFSPVASQQVILTPENPTPFVTPTPTGTKSKSAIPTQTPTPSPPSSNSNSNSTQPTNTPTPVPTATSAVTPTPTTNPSQSWSSGGVTVTASCSGSSLSFSVVGDVYISSYSSGAWGVLADNTTGQSMIYEYVGGSGPTTPTHVAANFPPTGRIRGSIDVTPVSGHSYSSKIYSAPYTTSTPTLTDLLSQVDFTKTCP